LYKNISIIGGGPSGLMAAEILASAGHYVTIYDRMPSLGRKFLMAGRGGLNLTHSEPLEQFISRYGNASDWLAQHINSFTPGDLRKWCEDMGQATYVGSSGRIFPYAMKAAPLLRAWLKRLDKLGVKHKSRHTWQGWEGVALKFINEQEEIILVKSDATLLALGGASWPRLGSDGGWVKILSEFDIAISPLLPANCGFIANWSEHFSGRFAGSPLKSVTIKHKETARQGEVMITSHGLEGGAVYAISSQLRESIRQDRAALINIDLRPNMSLDALAQKLHRRGNQSLSTYLRKAGFSQAMIGLLREVTQPEQLTKSTPENLAAHLKALPVMLTAPANINRAISTAGGVKRSALDENFMLIAKPGVFVTGEMLDWEAPTGGYLLQACFSTAVACAKGVINFNDCNQV